MKRLFSILLGFLGLAVAAQDLQVKETINNPSNRINDGVIRLEVSGGRPPYTYKWSNQNTPLSSNRATGLVEGIPYEVEIFDAQGNSVTRVYTVPTEAITEVFNGAMTPAVSALGSVLFWDPFAATGIYDIRGGGAKRLYRIVDFKRTKFDVPATVERIEYDPNRTAHIALLLFAAGAFAAAIPVALIMYRKEV